MDDNILRDAASIGQKIHKGSVFLRILFTGIAAIVGFMFVTYATTASVIKNGQYTVSLNEDGMSEKSLSLSETQDFLSPTVRLVCPGIDQMTNISSKDIPNGLHDLEGSNNGQHYIAYTFYLKNNSSESVNIVESMQIESMVLSVDEAMRVRVYRNGVVNTYAKIGTDGMPEYGTVPFKQDKIFETTSEFVAKDEIIKYTIVMWIEGDDPECLDNIRGGAITLSMSFSIAKPPSQDG